MDFELHISPLSSVAESSVPSLLARIWMWLSQIWGHGGCASAAETVFHLGPNDRLNGHVFQNLISAKNLNRFQRRRLARYTRLRLSVRQAKAWVKARRKARRFKSDLERYLSLRFFRHLGLKRAWLCLEAAYCGALCHAPLTPD